MIKTSLQCVPNQATLEAGLVKEAGFLRVLRTQQGPVVRMEAILLPGPSLPMGMVLEHLSSGDAEAWWARHVAAAPSAQYRLYCAVVLCREVASGLAAVHRAGIVHADLKPAQVLLGDSPGFFPGGHPLPGPVRLGDFGLAHWLDPLHGAYLGRDLGGSAGWLAPEALFLALGQWSEGLSPAADVWALGQMLLFFLTGIRPEACGEQVYVPVWSDVESRFFLAGVLLGEEWGVVLRELLAVAMRCLEILPNMRATAREVFEHLQLVGKIVEGLAFACLGIPSC